MFRFILFYVILGISTEVRAWDANGHRLIAAMAYQQLTPSTRDRVHVWIKAMNAVYPAYSDFVSLSTWPDEMRSRGISAFDHWHYVDNPFSSFKMTPISQTVASENVVWAIEQAQHIISEKYTKNVEKGIFLSFLIHFVGDVHQPLHTVNFYSSKFLEGDRGGSDYYLQTPLARSLHELWDHQVGWLANEENKYLPLSEQQLNALSVDLQHKYPRHSLQNELKKNLIASWSTESQQIAKQFAYTVTLGAVPSELYLHQGQAICQRQLALAAYRLADILEFLESTRT